MIPFGAVAVKLQKVENHFEPETVKGRAFSLMPLPVETDLPFHINGCFLISSNRGEVFATSKDSQIKTKNSAQNGMNAS